MSFYDTQPLGLNEDNPNAFWWPTPPFAAYPKVQHSIGPLPSGIEGVNGKPNRIHLVQFDLGQELVTVHPVGGSKPISIRFAQFRKLSLDEPVRPELVSSNDPHAQLLNHHPDTRFVVHYSNGDELTGQTVGHVELKQGLFLFPPFDDLGAVSRIFIPRHAYQSFTVGGKVGEILVQQAKVTQGQVNQVMAEQDSLRKRKLGDVLLSRQIISPEQLLEAIDMQAKLPVVRLGEALVTLGMISEKQLDEALHLQRQEKGIPLGELLIRKGFVTRENLQTALAHKMGYPVVDVSSFPIEPGTLKLVSYQLAIRLQLLPLMLRDGRLVVAMDDPTRRNAITELEFLTQCRVIPTLAKLGTLPTGIARVYEKPMQNGAGATWMPQESSGELLHSLEQASSDDSHQTADIPLDQSDNSLVRLINTVIMDAHQQGVSDIHIECPDGREKIRIRFRKDGQLKLHMELPPSYRQAVVARIKVMCDLDISERRRAQDGKINFAKFVPQLKLELRVATIPTANNLEDVVLRLLSSSKPLALDKIGLSASNFEKLSTAIHRPYGMVLCVGPTGSGKTTTLHSALGHINKPHTKIWTAEDPVEITQSGLRQVQVNPKIDWTFAKALKSFLRADPDVIMVGEIRDSETAHMAIEASLTGHLVLSTLHTNSAAETITRLLDMGMDPFNFADSLLAVLAQRLGRRWCMQCRTVGHATQAQIDEWLDDALYAYPVEARPERATLLQQWRRRFGVDGQLMHYHSPGCEACDGRGYKGRIGFHELLTVSRALRRMIQQGARAEDIQYQAIREGMLTLRQDGIEKVLQGLTSLEEVRAMTNN